MKQEPATVATLLELYMVDQAHARQVADLGLAIFDAVAGRYGLPARQRRLVEIGALLHNVGLTTDPPAHHLAGRDIVLRHTIAELSPREQNQVACMVAFHRKKVRPGLEPAYLALGSRGQREALQLAAILRVADGLDYCQSQHTAIVALEPGIKVLTMVLAGPHAAEDGERAVAKADLWHKVFGESLQSMATNAEAATAGVAPDEHEDAAVEATPSDDSDADDESEMAPGSLLAPWYADPAAPLAELGRVLLRRHLRRLRVAERGVRADKEIEAVHALRVATRRLRSTLRLLAPVYNDDNMRALSKGVGRIGRAAGAVRDRDVLLADLESRAGDLPAALGDALAALRAALAAERQAAHGALLMFLDSNRYASFIRRFAKEMNQLDPWNNQPRVRDLGGSTIWRQYEALRAHDRGGLPVEIESLHLMRIEGKRMRYVLELFSDTLGAHADEAVQPLVAFQDHMGILNDIAVAGALLAPHIRDAATGPATAAYLALRDQQATRMLEELPACWEQLAGEDYRRTLMGLIVRL